MQSNVYIFNYHTRISGGEATCVDTALARSAGMSLTLAKTLHWLIRDPEKTLTKKTFQIVKYRNLQHALFFRPLRDIEPSIAENNIIVGGTVYRNKIKITLGKYPVTKWIATGLQRYKIYYKLTTNPKKPPQQIHKKLRTVKEIHRHASMTNLRRKEKQSAN